MVKLLFSFKSVGDAGCRVLFQILIASPPASFLAQTPYIPYIPYILKEKIINIKG